MQLTVLKNRVEVLKQTKNLEEQKLTRINENLIETKKEIHTLNQTLDLLKQIVSTLIIKELKPIQDFVTFGLKKVFPDKDLEFKIEKSETASGAKYDFVLRDGEIEADLEDNFGGSVEEVCSLMLRLIVIKRLNKRPFIAMDEFFTGVDAKHRVNLVQLLKLLCEKSNFDIFLITHIPDFINDAHTVLQAYPTKEGLKIKKI